LGAPSKRVVRYVSAEGKIDQLPKLAAALLALKVDLIVALITRPPGASGELLPSLCIRLCKIRKPLGELITPG
jgi:hypothetical protein